MENANGVVNLVAPEPNGWHGFRPASGERNGRGHFIPPLDVRDPEYLRHVGWSINERRVGDPYVPSANHVGLAMVQPHQGFAHWRIVDSWVQEMAQKKGGAWPQCRLVLRLYDVSSIEFNGFNANRIQDEPLSGLCGHRFFQLPRAGTWQLGEVGFLLRSGEFMPAARSQFVPFAPGAAVPRSSQAALLVTDRGVEEIGNLWDQERILRERQRPQLKLPLRIAALALEAQAIGQEGNGATFVSELAAGKAAQGHEVHVFLPASDRLGESRQFGGVLYHPVAPLPGGSPVQQAIAFARDLEQHLAGLPPFDLVHLHDWMAGLVDWPHTRPPTLLSLSSIEATRRNGSPPCDLSREIEEAEQLVAQKADCILVPHWLVDRANEELGIEGGRIQAFPLEGRLPNEWECPLDLGQVKKEIGLGPLDRLALFIGPLEHASGVDLLVEALPPLMNRAANLRLVFVGTGNMHGHLQNRANQLGAGHVVRLLGQVEGPFLTRLVRSAEVLALPSRYRVPFDDSVVDLARRAGRPVITTHGGPAHLVRHEENGLLTYDNPGSMVWALDRILGESAHADRMGQKGRRCEGAAPRWSEVARCYLELCAACFPELSE